MKWSLGRRDAKGRRPRGFSLARMFRLTAVDRGQTSVEHIGMIVVVVAIMGALVATGVTTELGETVSNKICRAFGGSCGTSGDGGSGQAGGTGGTSGGQRPASDGSNGSVEPKTKEEKEYEQALKDLQDAEGELSAEEKKTVEAAKKLAKILADELGITDAVKCFTEGDPASCGETAINIVLSLIGGLPAKILKKYGWPTQWKKGAKVAKDLVKHGKDVISGAKGIYKAKKKVDQLRKKVDDLKKKLPKKEEKPKDGDKPKQPGACGTGKHSFLPGTPVLLADGTRTAIEDVRVGDLVTATDPESGLTTSRPVVGTITTRDDKEFVRLTVQADGGTSTLTATDTHPFWLVDRGRWADAGDIRPGAELRTPSGSTLRVSAAAHYTQRQRTHDLTVEGIHTYYVGVGRANTLVHNNDDDCGLSKEEVEAARNPTVGEGNAKKFKDHFQRHKKLLEDALGTKYPKLKADGPRFRQDIEDNIKNGTFKLEGKGTLKKDEPEGLIYRGKGVTIVLRENGDFWTMLKSGEGLDTSIEMTKKVK